MSLIKILDGLEAASGGGGGGGGRRWRNKRAERAIAESIGGGEGWGIK